MECVTTLLYICGVNNNNQKNPKMSSINEIPKYEGANCPYLDSLKSKLQYAKEYHPTKVDYYERLIKEWVEHTPQRVFSPLNNDEYYYQNSQELWQFSEPNDD